MPFWSGETLLANGPKLIDPFTKTQVDCNAYVLRMGAEYYRTADQETGDHEKRNSLAAREGFIIPPGQFAFLLSKETVRIPLDAMAFISMRTKIKFKGLINVSGFHVDPGYEGKLVYAVYNASPSPVHIAEDDKLFKIWFCAMDRSSAAPYIKQPTEGYNEITSDMVHGMSREILSLQSLAAKLAEQKPKIDDLSHVWKALQLGVIGAAILALISLALPLTWETGKALRDWILPSADQENMQPAPLTPATPPAVSAPDTNPLPADDTTP